jgi:hypothetical protein
MGHIQYPGRCYAPEDNQLRLLTNQNQRDAALGGHPWRAKTFALPDRHYNSKDMRRQVNQYVRNSHDSHRSRTLRHAMCGILPIFASKKYTMGRYFDGFCG